MMTSAGGQLIVAVCPGLAGAPGVRPVVHRHVSGPMTGPGGGRYRQARPGPVARGMYAELVQRVRILPWREASEVAVEMR